MANSIPTSEIRFQINPDLASDKIDLAFYVIAHELTHQWWGNQLAPANALGAKMLTESITEYISLNIYRNYYGEEQARDFLKQQHKRYLKGRSRASKQESPLYLVSSKQEYISYGKGTIALNALAHHLGEAAFNKILQSFLLKYQFNTQVYPTTLDFIQHLKNNVPNEYHYMIHDYFEDIVFYENNLTSFNTHKTANNQFETSVNFEIVKKHASDTSQPLPLDDFIELGFYNENGELFHTEKVKTNTPLNEIKVVLNQKAASVLLDPHLLLICLEQSHLN